MPVSHEQRIDESHFVEGQIPKVSYLKMSSPSDSNAGYNIGDYKSVYEGATSSDYEISEYKSIYDK